MSKSPEQHTWFHPNSAHGDLEPPEARTIDRGKDKAPSEFERLWRGFMTARVTLGAALLVLQVSLWVWGQSSHLLLIYICGAYLAVNQRRRRYFRVSTR